TNKDSKEIVFYLARDEIMRRIALASASLYALVRTTGIVCAQEVEEDTESVQDTIVVIGSFQKSLSGSRAEKRNADQILDSVSAEA
ncbi:MAG: hypothetical protein AAF498_15410, partial [Pseudomonadota bacterium]